MTRKDVWLFAGPLLILSAIGVLLRNLELRSSLDESAMTMTFGVPSGLLLGVTAVTVLFLLYLCRRLPVSKNGGSYGQVFGRKDMIIAGAGALVLCLGGALSCLRENGLSSVLTDLLILTGVLAGVGWFSLSLDAARGRKGSFVAAVLPVIFACLFLLYYYKSFAQFPALLYTMYPFLALCAALAGLHLLAGWTVGKPRKRSAVFFTGLGTYLCVVATCNADRAGFSLFFGAMALELLLHGVLLIMAPSLPEAEEAGDAPAEADPEAPEDGDAPSETPENEG